MEVQINNQSFKFDNAIMEDHFNETYMETDRYLNSTFKGRLLDSIDYVRAQTRTIKADGNLYIHGIEQRRVMEGILTVGENGVVRLQGTFKVKLEDYNITKPQIVFKEIADEIAITVNLSFTPKGK